MAVIAGAPIYLTCSPTVGPAADLYFLARDGDADADTAPVDLTGYAAVPVGLSPVPNDQAQIEQGTLELDAEVADQTISPGLVTLRPPAGLELIPYHRYRFDLVLVSPGGVPERFAGGVVLCTPLSSAVPAPTFAGYAARQINSVLIAGPDTTTPPSAAVSVDLGPGGDASKVVFTSGSNGTVVRGATLRLTSVGAFVSAPSIHFRRGSDNALFTATGQALTGMNLTSEARVFTFNGTVPQLALGDTLVLVRDVAANASAYVVSVVVVR